MRDAGSRRTGIGAPPAGSSSESATGSQYRRIKSPQALPGPIWVRSRFSSSASISHPRQEVPSPPPQPRRAHLLDPAVRHDDRIERVSDRLVPPQGFCYTPY